MLKDRLRRTRRALMIGWVNSCAALLIGAGCRSDAHSDVYLNEMAAEIRVLEDQLYHADYENKVLREKLERTASPNTAAVKPPSTKLGTPVEKIPSKVSPGSELPPLNPPPAKIAPKFPPKADATKQPNASGGNAVDGNSPGARLAPLRPKSPTDVTPGNLEPPAIDFGTPQAPKSILPPSDTSDKIKLPESAQRLLDEPAGPIQEIRLDPSMTRSFLENGEAGLTVVFVALDADGRRGIPTGDVEIALIDPILQTSEGRLGRWTIPAVEVQHNVSADRVIRLKVYWDQEGPKAQQARLFVRLRNDVGEQAMSNQLVKLNGTGASADWAPRTSASGRKFK